MAIETLKKDIKKYGLDYEIIFGDSLRIIPTLDREYSVIYLDPPFNTNREFKYSAKQESHGFIDIWKGNEYEIWLDKLVSACKSKLAKNGTLFLHISAELSYSPQTVLLQNFKKVEPIFWKKAHGKNTVKNKLGSVVDVIYKCSNNGSKFNLLYVPLDAFYFENSYRNKDERGFYALGSIKHDKTRSGHFYEVKLGNFTYEAPYGWKISQAKMNQLLADNRIHVSRPKKDGPGMLYKKLYKHETKGKPLSNLWDDISYITRTTKDVRYYPTQKPVELLKRIISLASDEGDWVLDAVAGSGTTGVAALNLNRKVTLIDVNKKAVEIMKKRLEETRVEKARHLL